jgi:protein-tyrosine phosphatase
MLADRLGCEPEHLATRGLIVHSAGVGAFYGDGASETAIRAAAEMGGDLSGHRSRPVSRELLADATDVVTMTRSHAAVLMYRFPGIGPEPILLCGPAEDLPDPIGGDLATYRACTRVIYSRLQPLVDQWLSASTMSLPSLRDVGE